MNSELNKSCLKIRSLSIDVPLVLAPMVGVSHSAFRSLLMELGGVGLLFTEMLAAKRLPHDNVEVCPMLIRTAGEKPLIYQLFLSDEKPVADAIKKLHAIGVDGIDVNLGCPAPQLRREGAGGFLAADRTMVKTIIQEIRAATELPVSAKIRLGRELNKLELIDFCSMLEGEGIDFLTVHGRLHGEKFCRTPRWDWIGIVKNAIKIPVFANGGIFSVNDARKCLERSGADGLMIGRGGVEKPWLFNKIAIELYGKSIQSSLATRQDVYVRFVELLEERFPLERRLGRLKQFTHYFAHSFDFGHQLASSVQTSKNMDEAIGKASLFFEKTKQSRLSISGDCHD
ncbi:tRNA dihydrouridine synthase [Desulfosediminicola flagellatus]|uniref:tRNA dihydrouridine synthase n=1 Tax=Desulfosediminicola flagellatus TaxID=2569541 RepID=UPI0010ABFDD0|nr:tRNA-dihydrouridine synthase family protein [Desulfosediminicola flagellatus]